MIFKIVYKAKFTQSCQRSFYLTRHARQDFDVSKSLALNFEYLVSKDKEEVRFSVGIKKQKIFYENIKFLNKKNLKKLFVIIKRL